VGFLDAASHGFADSAQIHPLQLGQFTMSFPMSSDNESAKTKASIAENSKVRNLPVGDQFSAELNV